MASYRVVAAKTARDQLAILHLTYRQKGLTSAVARADYKITKALQVNPHGGLPVAGTNRWTVTVRPLIATYQIIGQEVQIVRYGEKA